MSFAIRHTWVEHTENKIQQKQQNSRYSKFGSLYFYPIINCFNRKANQICCQFNWKGTNIQCKFYSETDNNYLNLLFFHHLSFFIILFSALNRLNDSMFASLTFCDILFYFSTFFYLSNIKLTLHSSQVLRWTLAWFSRHLRTEKTKNKKRELKLKLNEHNYISNEISVI